MYSVGADDAEACCRRTASPSLLLPSPRRKASSSAVRSFTSFGYYDGQLDGHGGATVSVGEDKVHEISERTLSEIASIVGATRSGLARRDGASQSRISACNGTRVAARIGLNQLDLT